MPRKRSSKPARVRRLAQPEAQAPPGPAFDPARSERIRGLVEEMLLHRDRDPAEAGAVVEELERWSLALARRPGEQYVGPFLLFAGVVRAAGALRDALEKLIRQRAVEEGSWDYAAFLHRAPTSAVVPGDDALVLEATRLHSDLSIGQRLHRDDPAAGQPEPGSLAVSTEALQCFLAVLVLLAEAPLKKAGRPEDQERALLDWLVLDTLTRAGLPCRAGERAGFVLAEVRALAFGDTVDTVRRGDEDYSTKTVANLRYAAQRKGRKATLERTVAQLSLAQRARQRLTEARPVTPVAEIDEVNWEGGPVKK